MAAGVFLEIHHVEGQRQAYEDVVDDESVEVQQGAEHQKGIGIDGQTVGGKRHQWTQPFRSSAGGDDARRQYIMS